MVFHLYNNGNIGHIKKSQRGYKNVDFVLHLEPVHYTEQSSLHAVPCMTERTKS